MKLHLPLPLRHSLLFILAATTIPAWGGGMHEDVNILTYADFGQNKGRYAVGGAVNELLDAIRLKDGGIKFEYQNPSKADTPYIIDYNQGMINYSATADIGAYNAISPTFIATVLHNGSQDGSFSEKLVGSAHAINYEGIDIRGSDVFRLAPEWNGNQYDYMIQRQSKLITDVTWNPVTVLTSEQISNLGGTHLYHSGAGVMTRWEENPTKNVSIYGPYQYVTGGINNINTAQVHDGTTNISLHQNPGYGNGFGATEDNPVPNSVHGGDSGSPVFIYNESTKRYEYIAAQQSAGGNSYGQARGNAVWSIETMEAFNAHVNQGEATTVYLNAIDSEGGTMGSDGVNLTDNKGYTTTLYSGNATDENGNILATYNGIKSNLNTWADLSGIKDTQEWYAYGKGYLQRTDEELFFNSNLSFNSAHSSTDVILNATVDLGVGYVEFSNGSKTADKVSYTVKSADGKGYLLNSAGYVVNDGAEVHVQLTNPENFMREWRKNGAGDLYIDGTGNTNALLALGGTGTTYLQQTNGHAAYNVLASSGAKVVIKDASQIERDFTFGAGGGTLDMNGVSMDWYASNGETPREGCFTINALTEEATITNEGTGISKLTYKEEDNQTFLGSFRDSATGALQIDYQGNGTWTLNSINTKLTNADSKLIISNGEVVLSGINTIHGMGTTDEGKKINRLMREDDWHYADATMNVEVASGASFELGSHARLTGTVTVAEGATYTMREGVRHQLEYVEGGLYKENTYAWEKYYGHKGDTVLNGTLNVAFSEGTTANTTYAGNISGTGNMTVDTADGSLTLTGNNTFTGTRQITAGTLIAEDESAAGTSKWVVGEKGVFALQGVDATTALNHVDTASTGVLALTQDTAKANTANHTNLIIGAAAGETIQYGTRGTSEKLDTVDGAWRFGGGGGELVVNYALTGDGKLLLGNEYAKGVVSLTNGGNNFTGGIHFLGSGVTLKFTDAALANVSMELTYGNRASMSYMLPLITAPSKGIFLQSDANQDVDMSSKPLLFLGSDKDLDYSGTITVGDNQAYRLSASDGVFTVNSAVGGNHDLIVDAQTYSGGTVVLNNVNNLTGNVTVMGYDSTQTELKEGDITLVLNQDNVLDSAASVTLKAGATLNIGDSTQHISNLVLEEGATLYGNRLTDKYDTKASDLHLTINSLDDYKGTINVGTIHKYGDGILELSNRNNYSYSNLVIEEGDVKLTGTFTSALDIRNHTLDLNGQSLSVATVFMEDGGKITISKAGSTFENTSQVNVSSGIGTIDNCGNDVTLNGYLSPSNGATLKLMGDGKWTFSSHSYSTVDGTLQVNSPTLDFTALTSWVQIKGTLDLPSTGDSSDVTINFAGKYNNSSYAQDLRINRITMEQKNLVLQENTTNNAQFTIGSLDGSGTVTWNATKNTNHSSRLILNGEGNFIGKLTANRASNGSNYNSFVELAHDKALQNATLELNGMTGSPMSLAVNTANAQVKGLTGNEYSHAYSGAFSATKQATAPTGDGKNTLTITGSETYEYKGAVNGLNIAMNGTGKQIFSGSNISAPRVSALQGTLVFTNALTEVSTITVAQGATLDPGAGFTLSSGQTLALVAGKSGTQATLSRELVLNGGTLSFDGKVLNGTTSLLNGTYSFTDNVSSQAISLTNEHAIITGKEYLLLSGYDWTGMTAELTDVPDYLSGTFSYSDNALKVIFSLSDGLTEWQEDYSVFQNNETVLFRNEEYETNLLFAQSVESDTLNFVNKETYRFSGEDVTLSGTLKMESGRLELNNKLTAAEYSAAEGVLHLGESGQLELTNALSGNVALNGISGSGTLSLMLGASDLARTTSFDNTLAVDEAFTGTTRIESGNFTLNNDSRYGSRLELADGVNFRTDSDTTMQGQLVLDGATDVYQESHKFVLDKEVSGNGTWTRKDTGNLVFNSSVDLGCMVIEAEGTANTFNSAAEFGSLSLGGNNTTLNGAGSVTTGTLQLTEGNTVTIDTLTVASTEAGQQQAWNGDKTSTINLLNGATLDTRNTDYKITGTMVVGGATADGTMYVNGIQLSNNKYEFGQFDQTTSTRLDISKGSQFVITGEEATGAEDDDFALANYGEAHIHSGKPSIINVAGILTSNAGMSLMRNHAQINIQDGGALNLLKGLTLVGNCRGEMSTVTPPQAYATINVQNGGSLYAAGGTQHANLNINVAQGGTFGAIGKEGDMVKFTNNINLSNANKKGELTIDTAAHTVDADFNVVRNEDKGVTIDMAGNLTFASGSATTLHIVGSGTLLHKDAFNNTSDIQVQKGATLSANGNAVSALNTAVQLNNGSLELQSVNVAGDKAKLTIREAGTVRATSGTSQISADTKLDESAVATYDVANGATLKSTGHLSAIGTATVIKSGLGTLHLNNSDNAVNNITVDSGELNVHGAVSYDLIDLEVATSASLGFYAGIVDDHTTESQVQVSGSAEFGTDAKLYANLTLIKGASLEVAEGGLAMGSTLTLQEGLTLGAATLARVRGLSAGESTTLFSGVDGLSLNGTEYSVITEEDAVLAMPYFYNLDSNNYLLTYTGTDGSLSIMAIPEPTSSMLGLVGLVAFTLRRRRK